MFTRFIPFEKYADEVIDQGVDFAGVLQGSESVTAAGVKAVDVEGSDVTSTLIPDPASLDGSIVQYRLVAAGIPGYTYHIYALATLDTGEVLGQLLRMFIPEP